MERGLQFQSLYPNSLPNPQPLVWLDEDSKTLTTPDEDQQSNTNTNTLLFQLHHLDSLSFNSTPHALFNIWLQRDAIRVKDLTTVFAAVGTNATAPCPRASRDFSSSEISRLAQGSGEYFTRLRIGTPAETSAVRLILQATLCGSSALHAGNATQADPI